MQEKKTLDNIQHPFMLNTLNKLTIEENFRNMIKAVLIEEKHTNLSFQILGNMRAYIWK